MRTKVTKMVCLSHIEELKTEIDQCSSSGTNLSHIDLMLEQHIHILNQAKVLVEVYGALPITEVPAIKKGVGSC